MCIQTPFFQYHTWHPSKSNLSYFFQVRHLVGLNFIPGNRGGRLIYMPLNELGSCRCFRSAFKIQLYQVINCQYSTLGYGFCSGKAGNQLLANKIQLRITEIQFTPDGNIRKIVNNMSHCCVSILYRLGVSQINHPIHLCHTPKI